MEKTESSMDTVFIDPATDVEEDIVLKPIDKPWQFQPGVSGNPGGRPKDPVRDYLRRKFQGMTDLEIETWLVENKISGEFQWRQAEGNPTESKELRITVPTPILGGSTQQIQGEIVQEVLDEGPK